jgi:hypothetical protein
MDPEVIMVLHYEKVRKKYAKTRSVFHSIGVTCGTLSVVLSASGFRTSLTGPGIAIGVHLGALGGLLGIVSACSAAATKKLSKKVSKHENTIQLAKAKANTVADLVLRDGNVDEKEFEIILAEEHKYTKLKNEIKQRNQIEIVRDLSEESRKKYTKRREKR